ncbi:replication initiation protein [Sebaldella sp. S0638]|uniref:replication initiation protein n=1 Tax=Sebaldella sp. S0638 TaxID=2957809 RepID=UPI00209D9F31|nr:replication initiation protein [Sebaldella sp. S0638]MCP1223213.1 replication initiation protein [Sebaldella sp. S0638]
MEFFYYNNYKISFDKFLSKHEKVLIKNFIHKKIEKYSVSEFLSQLDVNKSELHTILDKFQKKNVKIYFKEDIYSYMFLSGYETTSNIVILQFSDMLKNISQMNTIPDFQSVITLQEKFTLRFFLKYCQDINDSKKMEISVEDLKESIEVDSYSRFYDFEKFILKTIASDIEENTPYIVFYDKIKSGSSVNNKIVSLSFIITNKNFYANSKFAIELLEKTSQYINFNTAITKITELLGVYPKDIILNGIKNLGKNHTIENHLENIIKERFFESRSLLVHIKEKADNIILLQKILFTEMEKIKESEIFDDQIVNSRFNKKFYMINIDKKIFFETKSIRIEILELSDKFYDIKIYKKT